MRIAVALVLVSLVFSPVVHAKSVSFEGPAQIQGQLMTNTEFLVLLFEPGDDFEVQLHASGATENRTFVQVKAHADPIMGESAVQLPDEVQVASYNGTFSLRFGRGLGSLAIAAESILVTNRFDGHVAALATTRDVGAFAPSGHGKNPYWTVQAPMWADRAGLVGRPTSSLHLSMLGVQEITWFGAVANCEKADACPDGGGPYSTGASNIGVYQDYYSYWSLHGMGHGEGFGTAGFQGLTSSALDFDLEGWGRFPKIQGVDCRCDSDESLLIEGSLALQNLQRRAGNQLEGELQGHVESARLDEAAIDPDSLGVRPAVMVSAALGLLAVAKLLILPLFTRLSREKALEHPRRKAIFDYIHDHPGANFREVARNTGIAAGTVRHHLNVLRRSEVIVEHAHGSTVRLFENQLRFQQNWADLVLLREPSLGLLHDWLKANPGSPQKGVLEGMEAHGWSRSTTQHRLARLVDGGLASIRLQGRLKIYSVVDRSAPTKAPPAPFGSSSANPA
jgi:predicted transcriptional regulator